MICKAMPYCFYQETAGLTMNRTHMTMDADIRPASLADALTIAKLHAESWQRHYASDLTSHYLSHVAPTEREELWRTRLTAPKADQYVVVAQVDGEIAGFGCAYLNGVNHYGAYLDNLHVANSHRGKGIGRALLRSIAHRCNALDAQRGLCLLVNQSNTSAQQFYLRLGATHSKSDVWRAPDGTLVPTYWFTWADVKVVFAVREE